MNGLKESAKWFGDLDDDCFACWHGMFLRAEAMSGGYWWWAVYDFATGEQLDSSNEKPEPQESGIAARIRCEAAARQNIEKRYAGIFASIYKWDKRYYENYRDRW